MSFNNQSPGADSTSANAEAAFGNSFTSERNDAQHDQNDNHVQRGSKYQEATMLHDDDKDNASTPYEVVDDDTSSDYSDDDDKKKASVSCRRGGTGSTKTTTTKTSLLKKKRKWEESFKMLLRYKNLHGHVLVPFKDPQLGQWVSRMRQGYSRQRRGLPTAGYYLISKGQIQRLNDIGFVWNAPRGRPRHQEDRQEQQQPAVSVHQEGNKQESKLAGHRKAKASDHHHHRLSSSHGQNSHTSVLESQQGNLVVQSHRGKHKLASIFLRNEVAVGVAHPWNSPFLPKGPEGANDNDDDDDWQEEEEEEEETEKKLQVSNYNPASTSTTMTITRQLGTGEQGSCGHGDQQDVDDDEKRHHEGHELEQESRASSAPESVAAWSTRRSQTHGQQGNDDEELTQRGNGSTEDVTNSSAHATMSGSETKRDTWEEMYKLLVIHREKHGHTLVTWRTSPKLKNWIHAQRAAYSRERRGVGNKGHQITQAHFERLDRLGFVWNLKSSGLLEDPVGVPKDLPVETNIRAKNNAARVTPTTAVMNVQNPEATLQDDDGSGLIGGEKRSTITIKELPVGKRLHGGEAPSTKCADGKPAADVRNVQNSAEAILHDNDSSIPMGEEKKSSDELEEQIRVAKYPEGGESRSSNKSGAAPNADDDSSGVSMDKQQAPSPMEEEEVHNHLEDGSWLGESSSSKSAEDNAHEEHEDEMMASAVIDSVAPGVLKPPPGKRQRTNPTAFDATNDATSIQNMHTAVSLANDATRSVSMASSYQRQHDLQSETDESDEEPTTRPQPKDNERQDRSPSSMLEYGDQESHQLDGAKHQDHRKRKQDESEKPVVPLTDKQTIISVVGKLVLSDNSDEIAEAMGLLSSMVSGGPDFDENRTIAFRCSALGLVVKAMHQYNDCPKIQRHGCRILVGISVLHTEEEIMNVRGLQASLSALERYPDHPLLQATACNLIGHLLRCPSIRKTVVDDGGLTAMVKVMKSLKRCMGVQLIGCKALLHLVSPDQTTTWAEAVIDAGGIDIVIQAIKGHPENAELQKNGCTFLTTLAKSQEDYRERIFRANALAVIANILWVHRSNEIVWAEAKEANKAIIGA